MNPKQRQRSRHYLHEMTFSSYDIGLMASSLKDIPFKGFIKLNISNTFIISLENDRSLPMVKIGEINECEKKLESLPV